MQFFNLDNKSGSVNFIVSIGFFEDGIFIIFPGGHTTHDVKHDDVTLKNVVLEVQFVH